MSCACIEREVAVKLGDWGDELMGLHVMRRAFRVKPMVFLITHQTASKLFSM